MITGKKIKKETNKNLNYYIFYNYFNIINFYYKKSFSKNDNYIIENINKIMIDLIRPCEIETISDTKDYIQNRKQLIELFIKKKFGNIDKMPTDCKIKTISKINFEFIIYLFKYIFLKTEVENKNFEKYLDVFKDMIVKNNFNFFISYQNKWMIFRPFSFKNNIKRIKKNQLIGY